MAAVPVPHQFAVSEDVTADNINTYYSSISFLENTPIAILFQSSGQSFGSGITQAIAFDASVVDNYGGHSNVTNNTRYTSQVAGYYQVCSSVSFPLNSNGGRSINLRKNGSDIISSMCQQPPSSVFNSILTSPTIAVFLNVGDYIETVADQTSGSSLTLVTGAPAGSGMTVQWIHV